MIARSLLYLKNDARGATVIEFAVACPVLLLLLIGIYNMAWTAYLRGMLQGAVQDASRGDGLETANNTTADAYVTKIVKGIAPNASLAFKRMSYYDFADIKRAESWNDRNGNGKCDAGETYTDENKNGRWDADVGSSSNGGANDVVLYTVTVTYKPVFVVPFVPGAGDQRQMSATAVRKNQPFALQSKYGSAAGTCP